MAGIGTLLRPYQRDAVERMHNGCILCGDVGSGKSRTALAYYYVCQEGDLDTVDYYPMVDPPQKLYIITTARKRDTQEWEKELAPFLFTQNPDGNLYAKDSAPVIDSWNNIKKYADIKGAFFIFDEQRVVGSGAWVNSFLKIARVNNWILLSATPGDCWSDYIPVFIANGFYRNRTEFLSMHASYKPYTINHHRFIDHYINTGRLLRLRREILINMEYRKPTVLHHEDVSVGYDIEKYRDIMRRRWNPFTERPIENASEYCFVLRHVVNGSDSRQVAVLELFEQHPKVIIFYNYDYELNILRTLFSNTYNGVTVAEWNGHKHEPVPHSGSWVYLVQYTAGAEGWNCIETDTIIFYSQNYSYKIMKQAAGRIDRLNTPFTDLYFYHLKSKSGIDLKISRALAEKKDFNVIKFAGDKFKKNEEETDGNKNSLLSKRQERLQKLQEQSRLSMAKSN